MSNIVTLSNVFESEDGTLEDLIALASKYGELWLARFVPVLRGAILIFATHTDAVKAQVGLHGQTFGSNLLCSAMGARTIRKEEIEEYSLAAPKRMIQLISPPPSPPDTWTGWQQEEDAPKPPPSLLVEEEPPLHRGDSRVRDLNILACDLYSAVQQKLTTPTSRNPSVPRITIEAPPESLTGLPEGFVVLKKTDDNE